MQANRQRRKPFQQDPLRIHLLPLAELLAAQRGNDWQRLRADRRDVLVQAVRERLRYLHGRLEAELTAPRLFETYHAATVVPALYARTWEEAEAREQGLYEAAVNAFFQEELAASPSVSPTPGKRVSYPFVATSRIACRIGPGSSLYVHLACAEREFAGSGEAIAASEIVLGDDGNLYFPGEYTNEVTDRTIETTCCSGCGRWLNEDGHLDGLEPFVKSLHQRREGGK